MSPVLARSLGVLILTCALVQSFARAEGTATAPEPDGMMGEVTGAQIYAQLCQGCHMPDGRGATGAGRYPSFAGSPAVASKHYMAVTILQGRGNMPSFAKPEHHEFFFPPTWLTDAQVADVINHIRTNFGNHHTDPITAEEVRALHP
jgi:mono/diheme cytochrome c family protein